VRPPQYGMQNAQVDSEMRQAQAQSLKAAATARGSQSPPPQHLQQQLPVGQGPPPFPPGAGQPQQAYAMQSQHRAVSSPAPAQSPNRATSPPSGPHRGPNGEVYRDLNGSPRALPQSSFGPPPPVNGPALPFDQRPRTMSNPGNAPPAHAPGPPAAGQTRRVVTDGRPQPGQIFSGPQPGQLFQYPGSGPPQPGAAAHSFPLRPNAPQGPQPGQMFNPHSSQPGQVFHHPNASHSLQYTPHSGSPGPQGNRPLPDIHSQQQGGWQPPARLPNPAPADPLWLQNQQSRPDFAGAGRRPSPEGYDPRRGPPGPGGYPAPYPGVPGGQGHPHSPLPIGAAPGPGFYSNQRPPPTQPGQIFNAYPTQGQGEYRRPAPVPGQYGAHHR
jgi:hypothetical protein